MDDSSGLSGVVWTADFERWGPGEERIGSPQEGDRAKQERLISHLHRWSVSDQECRSEEREGGQADIIQRLLWMFFQRYYDEA